MQDQRRKVKVEQTEEAKSKARQEHRAVHWNEEHSLRLRSQAGFLGKMEEAGHPLESRSEVQLEAQDRSAVRRR